MDEFFVLLDDCHASAEVPSCRLYSGFEHEHRCLDPLTLDDFWELVATEQKKGLHAVVFADYEWGVKLVQVAYKSAPENNSSSLRVLMFSRLQRLSAIDVAQWLATQDGANAPTVAGVCDFRPSVCDSRYKSDIARIRSLITRGETYQANYTFNNHASQYGSPLGLYRRLRAMQPVAYGVLAALPGDHWVLSSSPELFVRNQEGYLTTRPMKGTVSRHADPGQDQQRADWLASDVKNRAENVMIVDLLRNDLARISEIGSVQVPTLFAVETYRTVHQMTSTVVSRLRPGLLFPDVLRALFPCGSITGAPKLHTIGLLHGLEAEPRSLYCGAIGWIDVPCTSTTVGNFCMSVAIRTLLLGPQQEGRRPATLGVGGGIVLDSDANDEFAEAKAKAFFLTHMDPGFTLFETMRVSCGRMRHKAQHLQRLKTSAHILGFQLDAHRMESELMQHLHALDATQTHRLRLDLRHDGNLHWQHTVIKPSDKGPALLVIAQSPVPVQEAALLTYKTSLRSTYDAAIHQAIALNAFDAVFVNAKGEVTEGARSTLFFRLNGSWYTPPLACGVLAGVLRERLMKRCRFIRERTVTMQELLGAQALVVGSALRGLQHAAWLVDADGTAVQLRQNDTVVIDPARN